MAKKNIHTLNESDLKRMISKILKESLDNEAFLGIDFGIDERQRNRVNTFKYARLYAGLVQQVEKIAAELERRVQILQNTQGQGAPAVNEGLVGAAIKGVSKYGLKNGLKGAAKVAGKKAWKRTMWAGLAATAALFAGIPQSISARVQQFKNPAQTKPQEVIDAYGELAEWMGEMCQAVQENPAILGAAALQDSTLNGPGEVDSGPFMTVGEGAGMAASLGMACIPVVGWAAAAVFDAVDIASMVVSAGAKQDEEGLKMVEKQYEYINTAIKDMNQALAKSAQAKPQGTPQQQPVQQQAQASTQKRQLPAGYVVGSPAPFAKNDPQQIMRFQQYVGISPTGKWDNNTQAYWDNWLRQTYQIS
jgi:hypothetical protein